MASIRNQLSANNKEEIMHSISRPSHVVLLSFAILLTGCDLSRNQWVVASYGDVAFHGFGNRLSQVHVYGYGAKGISRASAPKLYFKLPDDEVKSADDLASTDIRFLCDKHWKSTVDGFEVDEYHDAASHNSFVFYKGKLNSMRMESSAIAVGAHREGPFIALPVQRQKLIEAFGEPEWSKVPVAAP
jgi:hypothetical protein